MESARIAGPMHNKDTPRKVEQSSHQAKERTFPNQPTSSPSFQKKKRPAPTQQTTPNQPKRGKYLSPAKLKSYMSEGRCFKCGDTGHVKNDCLVMTCIWN